MSVSADHRRRVRDTDPRINGFAFLGEKIRKADPYSLARHQTLQGDQQIGRVSETTMRTEVRARHLINLINRQQSLLGELDADQRARTVLTLGELETELSAVFGLLLIQLEKEPELHEHWNGPPIFRIRTLDDMISGQREFIAVVRDDDKVAYDRMARKHIGHHTVLDFYRRIVLDSSDILNM